MIVDSKQRKLNIGQIVMGYLESTPQKMPLKVMLPAVIAELSNKNVKTKQFGNTLFEVIPGKDDAAYFKAFNADTGANFVDNGKLFVVYARRVLGLKNLVTQFEDPAILHIFKIISMNPPMPGMGYKTQQLKSGETRVILNLGA